MNRVILKSRLYDRFTLITRLADIGLNFGEVYYQHDRVFVPRSYQEDQNYPRFTLRTEIRDQKAPPIYKLSLRRHIKDSGIDIVEATPILDYSASANIITQLSFTLHSEVSRQRRALKINETTRMYLDIVEGLSGEYIKIETDLQPSDKISAIRKDLEASLLTLGQHPEDLVLSPYTDLLQTPSSVK